MPAPISAIVVTPNTTQERFIEELDLGREASYNGFGRYHFGWSW